MLFWCGLAAMLLATATHAGEERESAEPRLILPGDHVVRAGEVIRLCWTDVDGISEMEILLSRDGGRHYSVCISPELDPARHEFIWRVPADAVGELRMRIRYNRNGREIEGAPTTPLVVAAHEGSSEPLGLPVPEVPAAPRPRGESADRATCESLNEKNEAAARRRVRTDWPVDFAEALAPAGALHVVTPFAPPRSTPLRT